MKLSLISFLMCLLVLIYLGSAGCQAAEERQELTQDGITISYPVGMEAKAREIARQIAPIVARYEARYAPLVNAMADPVTMGNRITQRLGCPEGLPVACEFLSLLRRMNQHILYQQHHFFLLTEQQLRTQGMIHLGAMEVQQITAEGSRDYALTYVMNSQDAMATKPMTPFPVLLQDDGSFQVEAFTANLNIVFANPYAPPIHEATEFTIMSAVYHHRLPPFTRWFNEGVANWLTIGLISELAPDLIPLVNVQDGFLLTTDHRMKTSPVNLPIWTQVDYELPDENTYDVKLYYACSAQLVERCFAQASPDALARVMQQLKRLPNITPEKLCAVITDVTKQDAARLLKEYTPASVQQGATTGQAHQLAQQAEEAICRQDYASALTLYRQALAITPMDFRMQVRLTWLLRRTGHSSDDIARRIKLLVKMITNDRLLYAMARKETNADMLYIIGRIYQEGGLPKQALANYRRALRADPHHTDALSAVQAMTSNAKTAQH